MVSWDTVIDECGLDELVRFAYGRTSKREFASNGTNCRKLTRAIDAERAREAAQRAVRHRTTAKQRRSVLS